MRHFFSVHFFTPLLPTKFYHRRAGAARENPREEVTPDSSGENRFYHHAEREESPDHGRERVRSLHGPPHGGRDHSGGQGAAKVQRIKRFPAGPGKKEVLLEKNLQKLMCALSVAMSALAILISLLK